MRIEILGMDITDKLAKGSFRLNYRSDNRNDLSFGINSTVREYLPSEGQDVKVYDDMNQVIFGGCIKRLSISSLTPALTDDADVFISVSSDGYNHIPSRRTIGSDYKNKKAGEIVESIVTSILDIDDITVGMIEEGATIVEYKDGPISVKDVLDDMAEASGFTWFIDNEKKLHFKAATEVTYCSIEIIEGGTNFYGLTISKSLDNYRNKQFVKGGTDSNGKQIMAIVENTTEIAARQALEGGSSYSSGVYGNVLSNNNISTENDAVTAANEELRRYKIPASISFNSYSRDFKAGHLLKVYYPKFGIYTDEIYLIESVSLTKEGDIYHATINATRRDVSNISTKRTENDIDFFSKIAKKSATGSLNNNSKIEQLSDLDFYANGFVATYKTESVGYRWVKDSEGKITEMTNIYTGETVLVSWDGGSI